MCRARVAVLVLAKLVTPPLLTVPLITFPGTEPLAAETAASGAAAVPVDYSQAAVPSAGFAAAPRPSWVDFGKTGLVLFWLLGSAFFFTWSLVRIYRFNRLLKIGSEKAPPEVQRLASELSQHLGLRETPVIFVTSAQLSPLVWWLGRSVRVLIPSALFHRMDIGQLRWILAHELGHVRRRDHLVCWLEWLACVCFWWIPVAWWARRNLRINEEICCDALVLSSLEPKPRTYASALMTVIEFLSAPVIRPPAMASEINSGGFLERRFKVIMSGRPLINTPRWLVALILLCASGFLPLGVALADRPDREDGTARIEANEDAGVNVHFNRLGVSRETMDQIRSALGEGGLTEEQFEPVLGGMLRVIGEMQAEGENFELDLRLRDYFETEIGLSDEQIDLIQGLASRAASLGDAERSAS